MASEEKAKQAVRWGGDKNDLNSKSLLLQISESLKNDLSGWIKARMTNKIALFSLLMGILLILNCTNSITLSKIDLVSNIENKNEQNINKNNFVWKSTSDTTVKIKQNRKGTVTLYNFSGKKLGTLYSRDLEIKGDTLIGKY